MRSPVSIGRGLYPAETGSLAGFRISSTGVTWYPDHTGRTGPSRGRSRRATMGPCSSSTPSSPDWSSALADRRLTGAPGRSADFRWAPLIAGGMVAQVLLFSTPSAMPWGRGTARLRRLEPRGPRRRVPERRSRASRSSRWRLREPAGDHCERRLHAGSPTPLARSTGCLRGLFEQPTRRRVMLGPLTDLFAMPAGSRSRTCSASATCSSRSAARSRSSPHARPRRGRTSDGRRTPTRCPPAPGASCRRTVGRTSPAHVRTGRTTPSTSEVARGGTVQGKPFARRRNQATPQDRPVAGAIEGSVPTR